MSSAVTHRHPTQSPSSLKLPYGYNLDLDFIKYCESVTQLDPNDVEYQRRQRRRQRQSMEVMLGIQLEMQSQMDELSDFWTRQPPEPPPRSHLHHIESPIVPRFNQQQQRPPNMKSWDSSLNDVVDDFEKTLERSNKGKDKENLSEIDRTRRKENLEIGDCMPSRPQPKLRPVRQEHKTIHESIENVDGAQLNAQSGDAVLRNKIRDLEEQAKLIPLLQIQIQTLRDERQHLQSQLESRSSSTSSSSPHPQPVFQAQRISPVCLNAIKAPTVPKRSNRSTGTNTNLVLHREVGCSPEIAAKTVQRGVSTDFILKIEGDGGRLYTEKDLKKAIEMAHAKMRKTTASIGVQATEIEPEKPKLRTIGCNPIVPQTSDSSCGTDSQPLTMTLVEGITIASTTDQPPNKDALSLSLKDMNKLPITRTNGTQTLHLLMHNQTTQSSPSVINKATDSNDLIRVIHRTSMTENPQKRDQNVHTGDLITVLQAGTNTPPPLLPITRTTASNTATVIVKSVGINCDPQSEASAINLFGYSSKIPRPSPLPQRKFVRQETFTVSSTQSKDDDDEIFKQCPAEALLKLTMTQHSPLPRIESPGLANFARAIKDPPVRESPIRESPAESSSPLHEEPAVGTSKMPMSPSIEYLDDDYYDDEDDEDDKFNDEHIAPSTIPLKPPPTSISTIRLSQQNRVKTKPTKEMIAALKVLNDHLQKSPEPDEAEIRTAREVASCEWFKISSTDSAIPENVEDYLDFFEEQSWDLLTYMVNLADKNGNTAMHYAVSHGNFDVVSILLDSKVTSINKTNNAGYTCVMLVSLAKLLVAEHRTVVQRLFKLADVNIRATKNSQTALMLAVSHGNSTIATMLVEAAADINIQDDDGSTALMCAAEHGHLDIVKFLLAQPDCDSTKVDVDGNTALKISLESGYHDIGCLLYAHEHLLRNKTTLKRTPSSMKSSTSSLN